MDLRDYTPERICEALGWLYGGEWRHNLEEGDLSAFTNEFNDRVCLDIEDGLCLFRGWFKRNIEDDVAHALEVTAPWEWVCHGAKLPGDDGKAYTQELDHGVWEFGVLCCDGLTIFNNPYHTEAATQSAARSAYLRWMRGGLER